MAREPLRRRRRHAAAGSSAPVRTRRSGGRRARILVGVATIVGLVAVGTTVGAVVGSDGAEQAQPVSFTATDDAYVSAARPDYNTGTSVKLVASEKPGDRKITYLRFVVPAGTLVGSARLTLNRTDHHLPPVVQVYRTAAGWSEQTLTMRTAPALGDLVGAIPAPARGFQVSLDVSTVVTGPGSYAFAVTSPATDDVAIFVAKEAGAGGPVLSTSPTPGTVDPVQPSPTIPTISPIAPTPTPSPTATPTQTSTAPAARPGCTVSKLLAPSCGAWFGAAPSALDFSRTRTQQLATFEATAGRQADIMHTYHTNTQLFPTAEEIAIARQPGHRRLLFINWKPSTSKTWAQVAKGDPTVDAQIDKLSAHIKSTFPERFFLSIFHEPENDVIPTAGSGYTATDYRAMYRHVALRLRANGTDNAILAMVYMGFAKWGGQSWFNDLYPGSDVVDWMGYDPYASAQPGYSSGTFSNMVNRTDSLYQSWPGFYSWASTVAPGKPMLLAEWGVAECLTYPTRKAAFFRGVVAEAAKYPMIKAMLYFDSDRAHIGDTRIASTQTSLAGFKDMVFDPYFQQTVPTS